MPTIHSIFGSHAPFRGLQEHMKVVHACAQLVVPLTEALCEGDALETKRLAKDIFRLEEEADALKHQLRLNLPSSLFMPVDRRDLLEVLHAQDSIADRAEDIAGLLIARDMNPHPDLHEGLLELVRGVVGVVGLCAEIISLLDELLEVGFRGKVAERVNELASRLNQEESRVDKLERNVAQSLFKLEAELPPVTVMFWYRLLEWIGALADNAETVGNNIRLVIAR